MNKDFDNISIERKRAVSHCINLQSQSEQLNLLIRQLENLAGSSNIGMVNNNDESPAEQLNYLRPENSIISRELSKAIKDQRDIHSDIRSLKDKINLLNKRLTK